MTLKKKRWHYAKCIRALTGLPMGAALIISRKAVGRYYGPGETSWARELWGESKAAKRAQAAVIQLIDPTHFTGLGPWVIIGPKGECSLLPSEA